MRSIAAALAVFLVLSAHGVAWASPASPADTPAAPPSAASPSAPSSPAGAAKAKDVSTAAASADRDAAKHAKRTTCVKEARAKKLVGAQKTAFIKECASTP